MNLSLVVPFYPILYNHVLPGIVLAIQDFETFKYQTQLIEKRHGWHTIAVVMIQRMCPDSRQIKRNCEFQKIIQVLAKLVKLYLLGQSESICQHMNSNVKVWNPTTEFSACENVHTTILLLKARPGIVVIGDGKCVALVLFQNIKQ